ncbi:hypothetical protein [Paenibacillus pasadenensis]|uniref:hypothetical protein n=1 Tax=Paenibacillus pasadenensis TaxID=217090 RepID=UPI00203A8A4A|nr:hypothetical protein [Paenibacillus pasadenensis]
MKKMLYIFLVAAIIPIVLAGCTKNESKKDDQQILKKMEQSLKEQNVPISFVSKQDDPTILDGAVPYVYKVDLNQRVGYNDRIEIYIFHSNKELKEGLKRQHYTMTTLASYENFISNKILLVYFASNGKTDKFKDQIKEVVETISF